MTDPKQMLRSKSCVKLCFTTQLHIRLFWPFRPFALFARDLQAAGSSNCFLPYATTYLGRSIRALKPTSPTPVSRRWRFVAESRPLCGGLGVRHHRHRERVSSFDERHRAFRPVIESWAYPDLDTFVSATTPTRVRSDSSGAVLSALNLGTLSTSLCRPAFLEGELVDQHLPAGTKCLKCCSGMRE